MSVNNYIKTGLAAYTEYEFRVVASNNYGESESDWTAAVTMEAGKGDFI